MEDPAVTNFRNYVRIRSVQPDPDYAGCVEWLQGQAKELNVPIHITECLPGKPVVVLTVEGADKSLPSILLNSHMDVVPVFPEHWKYEPFSAHKDENGDIYGRGTQDMKCVGVWYLEAIKKLKKQGIQLKRTLHVSFVPDEEIGGFDGMGLFIKTQTFKDMNVGFGLDEGYANPTDKFTLFYGERSPWWFYVKCPGQPGHGSQFLTNTAGEKIQKVINKFLELRDSEERRMKENNLGLGEVMTVNLTQLKGGVQFNVVPAELCVGFDIRIPPTVNFQEFEKKITGWCQEIGEGITFEFHQKTMNDKMTCVEDGKNVWWDAFSEACKEENVVLEKEIFPAGTDIRYLREVGIPALGFSAMNNTPILLHDHNEYLNEKVFLRGIDIYFAIIKKIANM